MSKCDRCHKQRAQRDLLRCACCDELFCIIDNLNGEVDSCADKHESGY